MDEQRHDPESFAEAAGLRTLGTRPVYVLTSQRRYPQSFLDYLKITDGGVQFGAVAKSMHDDIASWSSVSRHDVVPGLEEYLHFQRPEVVVSAVGWVVDRVREGFRPQEADVSPP
jgi:hypothetical protein